MMLHSGKCKLSIPAFDIPHCVGLSYFTTPSAPPVNLLFH